jgi:hypothetical protein
MMIYKTRNLLLEQLYQNHASTGKGNDTPTRGSSSLGVQEGAMTVTPSSTMRKGLKEIRAILDLSSPLNTSFCPSLLVKLKIR